MLFKKKKPENAFIKHCTLVFVHFSLRFAASLKTMPFCQGQTESYLYHTLPNWLIVWQKKKSGCICMSLGLQFWNISSTCNHKCEENLVLVGWEKMNVCISHWNIYWFQWMSKIMFLRLCIDILVGRFDIDIMVFLVFSSTLNWMLWKTSQIDLLWHLKMRLL